MGPAVVGQRGEVLHEVEDDLEDGRILAEAADIGVLRSEQLLGEPQHAPEVVLGQTEGGEDDVEREMQRNVTGEVALSSEVLHVVDRLRGERIDALLHPAHAAGQEEVVDDVAVRLVLVPVHLDQGLDRNVARRLGIRLRGQDGQGRVGEDLGIALNLHDVGVLGHGPERRVVVQLHPQDRRLRPNALRGGVPALRVGVGGGVGEDRPEAFGGRCGHALHHRERSGSIV